MSEPESASKDESVASNPVNPDRPDWEGEGALRGSERAASLLDIVYRDDQLVAINKPSGLLVHRSPIDRHETRFAVQLLRDQMGQRVYPVHRLDKPTSGLLLFALDSDTARELSNQLYEGRVAKSYLAIVRGHAPESMEIDHPLRDETDHAGNRISDGVVRAAQTSMRCLERWTLDRPVDRYPEARYSLVELSPHTGRHRQLRRHMKHISHPIIGDTRFGKGTHNRFFRDNFNCHRLLLAAVSLMLNHPLTGERIEIECTPEASFSSVIDRLREAS